MLNKKVLLGTLVAGALLLPQVASAGIVSGPCVNCHTMHNTDGDGNNLATGPNAQLTRGNSCEGCHAKGVGNTGTTGVLSDAEPYAAPQVDDGVNPNLAGYFSRTGADANQHNPYESIAAINADATLTGPPLTAGGAMTTCQGCHTNADGGHHGTGGANAYRMLAMTPGAAVDPAFGGADTTVDLSGDATTNYPKTPSAAATTYNATGMNNVCAACHGVAHGAGQESGGAWIRHPTDLTLSNTNVATNYNYATNYSTANDLDLVPLGTSGSAWDGQTGADTLMCITCHYSHGGDYADLLRFDYGTQEAGGTRQAPGCESCHSYGVTGM